MCPDDAAGRRVLPGLGREVCGVSGLSGSTGAEGHPLGPVAPVPQQQDHCGAGLPCMNARRDRERWLVLAQP